jgi:hypothetical protein
MNDLEQNSRRRGAECASDLQLDQLSSAELSGAVEQGLRAHLAGCSACAGRHAELEAEHARFAQQAPAFEALLASPAAERSAGQRRPSPPWLSRIALPAAAVLALGLGLSALLRERAPEPESTRTKGSGAAFGFVVRRGDRTFAGEAGQVLQPGDVLRFTLSSTVPSYAGVWGVDALGRVSPYQTRAQLAPVPAGQRQPLPEAAELDQSLGQERLIAVFCPRPLPASEIGAALAVDPSAPRLPSGCASDSLGIVKAPR